MRTKFLYFFLLSLCIVNFTLYIETQATVRYVSKTGTSTPPYTSWETAADSIQKCINYSLDGDTIIIANGVYHESLIVNKYLWLIGSSIDSTVIDGTGMADMTIDFQSDGFIQNLWTKGKGYGIPNTTSINVVLKNAGVYNCKITDSYVGIGLVWSSSIIEQCIITNVIDGYATYCDIDTCEPIIKNTIINLNNNIGIAIVLGTGGNLTLNNTLLGNNNRAQGIKGVFNPSFSKIINNNILAFRRNIEGISYDTTIVENNISAYASERGYTINSKTIMRNNISAYNVFGVVGPTGTNSDYNLYWQNSTHTTEGIAEHDIIADPMFVNDTIPTFNGTYDFHLQAYSPAIDAGDPTILDVDGSRSDIGMYGGPGGESYIYQNLAPKPPQNFQATFNNGTVEIKWDKYSEADFSHYNIYRSTIDGFEPGYSNLYSSSDTSYFQDSHTAENEKLYYRITSLDSADNESVPGEQIIVTISGEDEGETEIVKEFRLYQNFPNPFNPVTTIPFKIKEKGYVKVMIYDITGEILATLVNETREAGYYEVKFKGDGFASGIYLYRIEVIAEGNIPVFMDMKKMMLVK
jgi:hypothetical protein